MIPVALSSVPRENSRKFSEMRLTLGLRLTLEDVTVSL